MTDSSSQSPAIVPGALLAGKYRVDQIIGQGGMGLVVQARHLALDEPVALKFLLPEYALHPEASTRFLREAQAAVKLKSEHVARVSDVGTLDTGAPYMVMEFLEGADLSRLLENGLFAVEDAVDYIIQGCEAIAEAHTLGIVHRDLKPANLFLTTRVDGSPLVKVLDFGISKRMGAAVDKLTQPSVVMGSVLYMSPEQVNEGHAVDHRTDIYALGVALYELVGGKQPFYAETVPEVWAEILKGVPVPLREFRPDVPDGLATVIEKAYARKRGDRYQSIAELVVALAPYAPPRSQPTIDRVCRMGGLDLAVAGADAPPASAPPGTSGGMIPLPVMQEPPPPSQVPAGGGTQPFPLPPAPPAPSAPLPPEPDPPPSLVLPGHYDAPTSRHAAAAFAAGAGMHLTARPRPQPSSGRGGAITVSIAGVLVLAAVGAFLWVRSYAASPAASTEVTTAPAPMGTARPSGAVTTAALPSASASAPALEAASTTAEPPAAATTGPASGSKTGPAGQLGHLPRGKDWGTAAAGQPPPAVPPPAQPAATPPATKAGAPIPLTPD